MPRVLVIGAGFAGMWAALGAARARRDLGAAARDIGIDVVAPTPMLCIKPRLYERHEPVLETDIAPLLAAVGVGFIAGAVESLEPARHLVRRRHDGTATGEPYDALVLATGSLTVPPPTAWRSHVHVLDSAADAMRLRQHLSALRQRPASGGRYTAVVVGAGFTGLEIATELAGWLSDLAAAQGERGRIVLLDRAATAGASLGAGPKAAIAAALAQAGVTFLPAMTVRRIAAANDADATVEPEDGSRIAAATIVWAGGLRAHPLGRDAGITDADGRLTVDATLRVAGHADIFAAGDMARAGAAPEHATLMSCQHAMPTGRVAGHNAVRLLAGLEPIAYAQPMYVTCLDLGEAGALLTQGWAREVVWTGADAKAVKRFINGRLIAPPAADRPELALQLADPTPLPVLGPDALAARWRAMLGTSAPRAAK
jgi:NADH dehydrogenase